MKLVPVSPSNMDAFLRLCRIMHEESRCAPFKLNEHKLRCYTCKNSMFVRLVEVNEEFIGFFIGLVSESFFYDHLGANDAAIFIRKESRGFMGGKALLMMIRGFEEWAQAKGALEIYVGDSAGITASEAIHNMYKKLGFAFVGGVAVKDLGNGVVQTAEKFRQS